jgi:bifunctional non-homologous end joining protein LigD
MLPRVTPINPARLAAPFDHSDFLYELKMDGFRCVAYIEDGRCELVSRKRNTYKSFAGLATAMAALRVKSAILDGEIVCLDGDGRSLFLDLLRRRRHDAVFYAFDLLWLDGEDLRGLPLIERKRRLRRLVRVSRNHSLLYADHIDGHGVKFFGVVCGRDCEGIVAKHKRATYGVQGPAGWFKILNPAYTQKRGRREMFEGFRTRSGASDALRVARSAP